MRRAGHFYSAQITINRAADENPRLLHRPRGARVPVPPRFERATLTPPRSRLTVPRTRTRKFPGGVPLWEFQLAGKRRRRRYLSVAYASDALTNRSHTISSSRGFLTEHLCLHEHLAASDNVDILNHVAMAPPGPITCNEQEGLGQE